MCAFVVKTFGATAAEVCDRVRGQKSYRGRTRKTRNLSHGYLEKKNRLRHNDRLDDAQRYIITIRNYYTYNNNNNTRNGRARRFGSKTAYRIITRTWKTCEHLRAKSTAVPTGASRSNRTRINIPCYVIM